MKKGLKLAVACLAALGGGYAGGMIALATAGRPAAVWGVFLGAVALYALASWALSPETTKDPEAARGWVDEGEHLPSVERIFSEETSAPAAACPCWWCTERREEDAA
jgi:hypothetical protein